MLTALATALLVSVSGGAQTGTTARRPVHSRHTEVRTHRPARRQAERRPVQTETERQLRALRDQIAGLQSQIDTLRSELTTRDQEVARAQQSVAGAQAQIVWATAATAEAAQQSTQNTQDVQQLKTSVGTLQATNQTLTATVVANQQQVQSEINSPTALRYKGITIQPVAFFAFEGVWRERSLNSGINTPFNSIPLPSANEGHVSELNFSGRQSRLGGLFTGDAGKFKLSGYFETDFLSSGTNSNNNQSNSYTLRQRQFWAQAATAGGFAVTGGQMWSLVTEDAHGTDNRSEIPPATIDPQYMVGFNWTRQPGIRLQQRFGNYKTGAFTLAMSLEQAQITNFTAQSAVSAAVPTNYFFAGGGVNGGLYNAYNGTYANNVAPDVMVKAAFDKPRIHAEFGGLARFLRDYAYPITGTTTTGTTTTYTTSQPYRSNTAVAGGAFGALRVKPAKVVELGVQGMGGTGVGRYGSAQLADATIKPSGQLEPIRNYHGLFSMVTHEGRKTDIFAYYGGEYDQRTVYTVATGAFAGDTIGYGVRNLNDAGCYALPANPGSSNSGSDSSVSCASPTRYLQEGMFGFVYRAVDSPTFGRLQYSATYQYLQRNLWSGSVSTPVATAPSPTPTGPRAEDSMVHVSMRYYIP